MAAHLCTIMAHKIVVIDFIIPLVNGCFCREHRKWASPYIFSNWSKYRVNLAWNLEIAIMPKVAFLCPCFGCLCQCRVPGLQNKKMKEYYFIYFMLVKKIIVGELSFFFLIFSLFDTFGIQLSYYRHCTLHCHSQKHCSQLYDNIEIFDIDVWLLVLDLLWTCGTIQYCYIGILSFCTSKRGYFEYVNNINICILLYSK